ncbi:hypothetical protein M3Y97_00536800 [Aphelenchoides bicaudatus]|nr:hypothetical protein M3Y97_00536800 [Aphelenchoides bicaudatus]
MDSNIKKELVKEVNQLDLNQEDQFELIGMSSINGFESYGGTNIPQMFEQAVQEARVERTEKVARVNNTQILITCGSDVDFCYHGSKQFVYKFMDGPSVKLTAFVAQRNGYNSNNEEVNRPWVLHITFSNLRSFCEFREQLITYGYDDLTSQ